MLNIPFKNLCYNTKYIGVPERMISVTYVEILAFYFFHKILTIDIGNCKEMSD